MYRHNLVAAVKVGGKTLRERDGRVYLPFGSEYSIYLKNLGTTAVAVRVKLDGDDVLGGRMVVVPANQSIDLERFFDDDAEKGHRFRFIKKTSKIETHRGNRPEDGLLEIRYRFEVPVPEKDYYYYYYRFYPYPVIVERPVSPWLWGYQPCWYGVSDTSSGTYTNGGTLGVSSSCGCTTTNDQCVQVSYTASCDINAGPGITVRGSESRQSYSSASTRKLEDQEYVMVLQLCGGAAEEPVVAAITTRQALRCSVCGTKNNSGAKFCRECGASLAVHSR